MNELDGTADVSKPTESPDTTGEDSGIGIPLSRRQIVLLIGVSIVLAVLLWRRHSNSSMPDAKESKRSVDLDDVAEVAIEDQDGVIYVPENPEDELEKDAAVIEALRGRGKLGGE